jgi:hypothetical protein
MKIQVASLLFSLGIVEGRLHSASIATRKLGQGTLAVSNSFFEVNVNGT